MASWFSKRNTEAPQPQLTRDEAIERAQAHAKAHNALFEAPFDVRTEARSKDAGIESDGGRFPVYVIRSLRYIPMSTIEIDAVSGAILHFQTFPR